MAKAEAQNGLAKFGMLGLGVMGQNLALNSSGLPRIRKSEVSRWWLF